jgi:O-acetylhomoserine/O-acetylserine sulfhydrylase-like pyridoxal-dependent enzyme
MKNLAKTTQLVHAGERREPPVGVPVSTPIYPNATYTYASMAEMDKVFSGDAPDYIYARYGNPTVAALQEALATVENGSFACAYSSEWRLCTRRFSPVNYPQTRLFWLREIYTPRALIWSIKFSARSA